MSEPSILKDLKENTMKTASFIISILFAVSFIFLGCAEDTTELAFVNADTSDDAINDIVWTEDNVAWVKETVGYAKGEKTESKEVDNITSNVECTVDDGSHTGNFIIADVYFDQTNSSALTIDDGQSNTYTLRATQAK